MEKFFLNNEETLNGAVIYFLTKSSNYIFQVLPIMVIYLLIIIMICDEDVLIDVHNNLDF